jgi:uncharacterized membrane protein YecN with MAPEG domain
MMIVLPTTLILAAACAVLSIWLGLRMVPYRIGKRIAVGDGGDPACLARMRAHANFAEYAPFVLALNAGVELARGPSPVLWALAAAFVLGRILHPFGMDRAAPNALRIVGMVLTWSTLALLAGWAIMLAYQAPWAVVPPRPAGITA